MCSLTKHWTVTVPVMVIGWVLGVALWVPLTHKEMGVGCAKEFVKRGEKLM